MNVYLASSWRNAEQPRVLKLLRDAGHPTYDFREPTPGEHGFSWKETTADGQPPRTVASLLASLQHPVAVHGFDLDMLALRQCTAVVLLLPCGRSAHLEAGWAAGAGKLVVVYTRDGEEPELMYRMCHDVVGDDAALLRVLG